MEINDKLIFGEYLRQIEMKEKQGKPGIKQGNQRKDLYERGNSNTRGRQKKKRRVKSRKRRYG